MSDYHADHRLFLAAGSLLAAAGIILGGILLRPKHSTSHLGGGAVVAPRVSAPQPTSPNVSVFAPPTRSSPVPRPPVPVPPRRSCPQVVIGPKDSADIRANKAQWNDAAALRCVLSSDLSTWDPLYGYTATIMAAAERAAKADGGR